MIVPEAVAKNAEELAALITRERITVLNQTPGSFYGLLDYLSGDSADNLALRYIVFGGETLQPSRLLSLSRTHPEIKMINMYGITETTVHVTYREIDDRDIKYDISNIGRPIPTTKLYLLGANMDLLPVGAIGEIYVGGDGVARGYLSNSGLTAARFVADPFSTDGARLYKSGDIGRYLPDGNVQYLGRRDAQLKVRGYRIETGEVEAAFRTHEAVADAVVALRQEKELSDQLVAYIVPQQGAAVNMASLRAHVAQRLPGYMMPSRILEISSIPLTRNGKIDWQNLRITASSDGSVERCGPGTIQEEILLALFGEILGFEAVGVDDDFFDLGGHSLMVTRLVSRIRVRFGVRVSIRDVFESPTVRQLAKVIEAKLVDEIEGLPEEFAEDCQRLQIAGLEIP